ncbi:MAG: hypothetical protein MJK15_16270 [Colwellia sp.]|nr:hypothetical protein [Colwellia sp.]
MALLQLFYWPSIKMLTQHCDSIPKRLEDVCFRMLERFMIKALSFINGYSLKKGSNEEYYLLRHPRRAGLKMLYAALLISTRTLHGCSFLENAGAYSPDQPFSSINALPKGIFNSS